MMKLLNFLGAFAFAIGATFLEALAFQMIYTWICSGILQWQELSYFTCVMLLLGFRPLTLILGFRKIDSDNSDIESVELWRTLLSKFITEWLGVLIVWLFYIILF